MSLCCGCASRALTLSGNSKPEENVQPPTLSDTVVDSVRIPGLPSEDALVERMRNLKYVKMQEELIKVFSSLT